MLIQDRQKEKERGWERGRQTKTGSQVLWNVSALCICEHKVNIQTEKPDVTAQGQRVTEWPAGI